MKVKVRIKELVIRNFRGFRNEHRVVFNDGINIIHGPVGSGKTSIIQAIEYALYGTQLEVKERISRLVDLINEESTDSMVRLVLSDGSVITRVLRRSGESAREEARAIIGSITVKGGDVDRRITEVLGVDDDDFERFILVTHRTLEALVYGSVTKRSILIDKLFGLEILDNLNKSIPMTQIEKLITELRQKLASIKELPEITSKYGSIEKAREKMQELRAEIDRLRREEEELSRAYNELLSKREELLKGLKGVEEVYSNYIATRLRRESIEEELRKANVREVNETSIRLRLERLRDVLVEKLEEFALVKEAEELGKLVITSENLADALERIYSAFEGLVKLKDKLMEDRDYLNRVRQDLEIQTEAEKSTLKELESRLAQEEGRVREYRELVSKYGEPERVRRELYELKEKLEKMSAEERFRLSLLTVLQYVLSTREEKCPICGKPLSEEDYEMIRRRIKELSSVEAGESVNAIKDRISELERVFTRMESLRPIVNDYEATIERAREIRSRLDALITRLETIDGSIRDLDRRIQTLTRFIDEFRTEVDNVDKSIAYLRKYRELEKLRAQEEELKNQLARLGLDTNVIIRLEDEIKYVSDKLMQVRNRLGEYSAELSRLELILARIGLDKEDPSVLRRRLDFLEDLYNRLARIRAGIRDVQARVRDEMIRLVRDNVGPIFKTLYPYEDLESAGIEVTVKDRGVVGVVSEYTLYAIRPGGRKVTVSRLSDGQRLTIALSFLLSVYRATNHNVDFLLMDEPIPYVDQNIRRAFASLLARLVKEGLVGQVIITTQSEDLLNDILDAARNAGVNYSITRLVKVGGERRIEQVLG
ncbi:MAG: SMC family ATPase [Vulcanisaeta sp.]|nr:SMC family ATPase [Vulcanisaeta sp.]